MNALPESDAELVARIADGDRAAFAALIERHQAYVHKLAYRFVGHRDVADDLTQDAFLRVWRSAAGYRPTAAFTTWLYRMVVNLCRDWRRGQRYRDYAQLTDMPAATDEKSAADDQAEMARRVREAIEALPDHQREAVLLHRYGEFSHREIAEIMGKSESAVESYLVRAYAKLRDSLRSVFGPGAGSQESAG